MGIDFNNIDPEVPARGEVFLSLRRALSDISCERLNMDRELEEEMRAGAIQGIEHSFATLASRYPEALGGAVDRVVEQFSRERVAVLSKHDFGRVLVALINSGAPIDGRHDLFTLNPCKGHNSEGMHILDYVTFTSADHTGKPTNDDVISATRRLVEEGGLHPDSVTNEGRTPVAMTARNQNIAMLEYLLGAGANPNPVDPGTSEPFAATLARLGLHGMLAMVKATLARSAVSSVIDQAFSNSAKPRGDKP